jgi:hypothetical protein
MLTILIIIAAIALVAFLSYVIVNKVSKKFRPIISVVLWVITLFLGYKIYQSIMGPIEFNKEKKVRYTKVIENLKMIRDAEVAHKQVTGKFTDKPENLISFIDTAKFALTETKNEVITETRGRITVDVEKRIVDTVGYRDVRADFAGKNYKDMFNVPNTDAKFDIKIGFVEKVQGVLAPVFEAKVDKAIVLKGMNKDFVRQEKEALGGPEVRGEFISVGSLEDVKTSGNWPPIYDNKDEKDKDK